MFSLFNWLRSQVKTAVLAGVGDALQELEGDGTSDTAPAVALLRVRLQPALANAPANVPASASNLPQDEPADQTAQTANHRTNGRRKATAATAE